MTWDRRGAGRRGAPAPVAVVSFLTFVTIYLIAVCTPAGQLVDHETMLHTSAAFGVELPTAGWLARIQLPLLIVGFTATAAIVALRRSLRSAVEALAVTVLALGSAYLLKDSLDRPSFGVGPLINSFPSNTTAVFAALTVVAIAAAPAAIRPAVAAVAVGVGAFVSVAVIALQWHRPGDVVGAWLLAVCAAALVRAVSDQWSSGGHPPSALDGADRTVRSASLRDDDAPALTARPGAPR